MRFEWDHELGVHQGDSSLTYCWGSSSLAYVGEVSVRAVQR